MTYNVFGGTLNLAQSINLKYSGSETIETYGAETANS